MLVVTARLDITIILVKKGGTNGPQRGAPVVQFESRSLRGPLQALGLSGAREVADHQAVAMSAPDEDLGNLGDSREHVESVRQWKYQPSFHRSGMPPIRQRDTPPSAARRYLRPLLPGSGVRSPAHAQALCACPRVCAALVCVCEHMNVAHTCTCVCVFVCVFAYLCMRVCISMYVHTHTHTHTRGGGGVHQTPTIGRRFLKGFVCCLSKPKT